MNNDDFSEPATETDLVSRLPMTEMRDIDLAERDELLDAIEVAQ